jgi:nitrite reductase/ring-hydroxylating ferredoxin subunit
MAAYLGGNLVYEQKIGVDHTAPEKLPGDFVRVAGDSDIPPRKAVRVEHNGTPILLVRQGSQIYALAETCAHLGGPLSEGKLEDDTISCPWHGSRYSLKDGHVIDGPSVHPQPCLETRVVNGQIEVRKSNRKPSDQIAKKAPSSAGSKRGTGTLGGQMKKTCALVSRGLITVQDSYRGSPRTSTCLSETTKYR